MTQQELAQRAKGYMDALANGIDPITGRELLEDTVLNRPQMIRCFFYVSDILRQVAENGGHVGVKKAGKKIPFALSMEQRASVPFSSAPLPISQFTDLLNKMVDLDTMKKLSTTTVTNWMVEKGFLRILKTPDGRHSKRPTPQGKQIGLSTEQRQGTAGPYIVVLYDESAQRFIVDNLDEILKYCGT